MKQKTDWVIWMRAKIWPKEKWERLCTFHSDFFSAKYLALKYIEETSRPEHRCAFKLLPKGRKPHTK